MKILMMTDMEGVAGMLNHDDWVIPAGRYYEKGQRLLTEEVNAAIKGLCEGGATEILIVDGHGAGGIDPELLDERAMLTRGCGKPAWPWGLDDSYAAMAVVGQHAKAGTPYSHMTHTQWFNYIDLSINDVSIGEYGQMILCAMELGVPTIFASGENAFAKEAEDLTPGVVAVGIKQGLLPDGLDDLDTEAYAKAKLSATHMSPIRARQFIYEGACQAMRKLKDDPSSFRYPEMSPPYVRKSKHRQFGETAPYETRDEHLDSIIALMNMPFTPVGG